jgi:hypothetical protein
VRRPALEGVQREGEKQKMRARKSAASILQPKWAVKMQEIAMVGSQVALSSRLLA